MESGSGEPSGGGKRAMSGERWERLFGKHGAGDLRAASGPFRGPGPPGRGGTELTETDSDLFQQSVRIKEFLLD